MSRRRANIRNYSDLSMEECIRKIPTCPAEVVNLAQAYSGELRRQEKRIGKPVTKTGLPLKMFGGGKSGAFVFLLNRRRVLKYYTDAYTQPPLVQHLIPGSKTPNNPMGTYETRVSNDWEKNNQRPFREFLTMCRMSGTPGFPKVFNVFCAESPNEWIAGINARDGKHVKIPKTRVGLAVVSSIAPGTELLRLSDGQLQKITPDVALMIGLSMLMLVEQAQEKMGPNFEHFDLHPDNVFVDMNTIETYVWGEFMWDGPKVSLIDFDLVEGDFSGTFDSIEPPPEHAAKRHGKVPIAERTIALLIRLLGPKDAVKLTGITAGIKNTDIRNWYATISALFMHASKRYGQPEHALVICQDIRDCIRQNMKFFARESLSRGSKSLLKVPASYLLQHTGKRGRETASIEKRLRIKSKKLKQKGRSKTLGFLTELLKNRVVNESFKIYDRETRESIGGHIHPGYDDTIIRFGLPTVGPDTAPMFQVRGFSKKTEWRFETMFGGLQLDVTAEALAPKILLAFIPQLVADPALFTNVANFLLWFLQIFTLWRTGFQSFSDFYTAVFEEVKRNKIRVASGHTTLDNIAGQKKDIRVHNVKLIPQGGEGTMVEIVMGAPSYAKQFGIFMGSYAGVYEYEYSKDKTKLKIKFMIPPPPEGDPTIWDQIKQAWDQAKKDNGQAIKDSVLFLSTLFLIPELQEAVATLFCSLGPGHLQFVHTVDGNEGVTSRPLSTMDIFPPVGAPPSFADVFRSYKQDDMMEFLHVAVNYGRHICDLSPDQRAIYFRKLNTAVSKGGADVAPGVVKKAAKKAKAAMRDPGKHFREHEEEYKELGVRGVEMGSGVAKDFGRELGKEDPFEFVAGAYNERLSSAVGSRTRSAAKKASERATRRAKRSARRKAERRYMQ